MVSRKGNLSGYEHVKAIGKGTFGTAHLYKRLSDNQNVVIKEIIPSDMADSDNEARVMASLNHPNIIRYMGRFEKDGSLLIEMEYADNGNLAELIKLRRERNMMFKERHILDILEQLTAALDYMHYRKIIHRDLKTENIFLNENGTVKIGDFGLSKIMNTRSLAQTFLGTPYYLSPEMCEERGYNEKSDIWALGCILYELTCFRKPFEAPNLPALVQRISTCEYHKIPKVYSKDLSELIGNILQKDYVKRPSAQEIHDVIVPRMSEYSVRERPTSLTSLSSKNVTKRNSIMEVPPPLPQGLLGGFLIISVISMLVMLLIIAVIVFGGPSKDDRLMHLVENTIVGVGPGVSKDMVSGF